MVGTSILSLFAHDSLVDIQSHGQTEFPGRTASALKQTYWKFRDFPEYRFLQSQSHEDHISTKLTEEVDDTVETKGAIAVTFDYGITDGFEVDYDVEYEADEEDGQEYEEDDHAGTFGHLTSDEE
jgi:hypothetical protein